jgi:predicted MPP superfamily phosphohydrolase
MLLNINPISRALLSISFLLLFFASQLFWFSRAQPFLERLPTSKTNKRLLQLGLIVAYILLFAYNLPWGERRSTPTHLTVQAALLEAPFRWWILASLLGFLILVPFCFLDRLRRAAVWVYQKLAARPAPDSPPTWHGQTAPACRPRPDGVSGGPARVSHGQEPVLIPQPREKDGRATAGLPSASRRTFLQQAAAAACGVPFVAGAYGLFYGRLNLETTHRRIRLARCPRAFEGFRIAQLSDIHIGPFMTSEEVSRYVEIANGLKADLVTLTGDFVTWDPATQKSVVEALARLRAPFGVFGCLGNHEIYTRTEDSITRLFAACGTRILRQQRAAIVAQGAALNLIGFDFQPRPRRGSRGKVIARSYLRGIEPLMQPDTVNILLSHNPNSFDRAAELGIDLSLAGHTHGGQVTLEFVHPSLSPSRLITPYVEGWFEKNGAQLYVNRGIGTIGVPMRLGSRPEITVFELTGG